MQRAAAVLLCIAILTAGCAAGRGMRDNAWGPDLRDVTQLSLTLGAPSLAPRHLRPSSARGRAVVSKLLAWLRAAEPVSHPGRRWMPLIGDHILTVSLAGGKSLSAQQDYVLVSQGPPEEFRLSHADVLVQKDGNAPRTYRAPALARWLASAWKADLASYGAAAPLCSASALRARGGRVGGNTGAHGDVMIRNGGSSACLLRGLPVALTLLRADARRSPRCPS